MKFRTYLLAWASPVTSPPSRGAWIEIDQRLPAAQCAGVAPLAGGVD